MPFPHPADMGELPLEVLPHVSEQGSADNDLRSVLKLKNSGMGDGKLSPAEVMVFGDSPTDNSLFELFPHSVLITNPRLPVEQRQALQKLARYAGELPFGEGFAEVVFHILNIRYTPDLRKMG